MFRRVFSLEHGGTESNAIYPRKHLTTRNATLGKNRMRANKNHTLLVGVRLVKYLTHGSRGGLRRITVWLEDIPPYF
ncbi:hypothetical protein Y032_0546g3257 [Ancylostoma ceylanicum]|uniref:Uncharacterized protein n=1 Tax=Ancylostoma ceylanicum TaxID=53326 RepID=A0A016WRZ9_9BILA|nr:hypothetical protein Y032_0546g3257 [Ancylostoma ceylanicum]